MNTNEMDKELTDLDKEPESWPTMLNNMFDGDIEVIEVEDDEE